MKSKKHNDLQEAILETPCGIIRELAPPNLLSDHATRFMIRHLSVKKGDRAADVGCGSGVLAIFMALAGAVSVVGIDTNTTAIEAARDNATLNNVKNVEFMEGSLLEPIDGSIDLIAALLPHKPAPCLIDRRYYGGEDGTDLIIPIIEQARCKLAPEGILYLYLNGIANQKKIHKYFNAGFETEMIAQKKRYFTQEEFDLLTEGMFKYIMDLRRHGISEVFEDVTGLYFMSRIWRGMLR